MRRIFFFFLFLIPLFSWEKEELEKIQKTFLYGTYSQIHLALKKIEKKAQKEKKKVRELLSPVRKEWENLFSSSSLWLRKLLVEYIKKHSLEEDYKRVLPWLKEGENSLFYSILSLVRKEKLKDAIPYLEEEVKKGDFYEDDGRLKESIRVLGKLGYDKIRSFLWEKFLEEGTHKENQLAIVDYFSYVGLEEKRDKEIINKFLEILKEDYYPLSLRARVAYALSKNQISSSLPVIREVFEEIEKIGDLDKKKKYARFRLSLVRALFLLGDPSSWKLLKELLRDNDPMIRLRALSYLKDRIEDPEVQEMLSYKAEYDPSSRVRKKAQELLSSSSKNSNPTK